MPYPSGFPVPGSGYSPYPQYPPSTTSSYPPYSPYAYPNVTPQPASVGQPSDTGTIKDEHIRESLLTAIEEKLMRLMKEQLQQSQAELNTLRRTQDELKQGKIKLDAILDRLTKEKVINVLIDSFFVRGSSVVRQLSNFSNLFTFVDVNNEMWIQRVVE